MQPYPYTPSPYVPPAPARKSGKTWLWVLGGCGCFSVLAIAVIIGVILLAASGGGGIPSDKQAYVGDWSGSDATLSIKPDGKVSWERRKGSGSSKVENLPIQRFIGDDFEVGVGPFTTRFAVQSPPKLTAGRWTMTVEGVQLTRAGTSSGGPSGGDRSDDNRSGSDTGDDTPPGGGKQLRDLKMARMLDDDDMQFTSSFTTRDTRLTCVIYPRKLEIGENYGSRWYAERVPRLSRNKLIGEVDFPTITQETSQLTGIRLSLTSDSGFPPGVYRVEIMQDGGVIGTIRFTVE
ncbi:hypothetical protein J8C02_05810 [Chloracidobacterium sp. MS 40/45]|uniref:hypothetical protein n=1 Tax=Chloracidobacterium aggregatum TaxID=2851959 RepID=UPI001B8CAC89|nr:hypothetical protein [Chloracidobacterium aggregatum]QUV98956.1 hypothetical protein J8C02_05810 [Chloracidobacterium sp. MS 40/45]